MPKITIEELKKRFAVRDVAPWGSCVVVPGDDFDPDWETDLDDEGYSCVFPEIGGKKFTLVKLDKDEEEEPKPSPEPEQKKPRGRPVGATRNWSAKEDERLIDLWKKGVKIEDLAAEFPDRGAAASENRLQRLKKQNKIKRRLNISGKPSKARMRTPQAVIDYAIELSKCTDPAYSSRDIAKKIFSTYGVKVSNVAVFNWIKDAKIPSSVSEPTEKAHEKIARGQDAKTCPEPESVTNGAVDAESQHMPDEESEELLIDPHRLVPELLREIRDLLRPKPEEVYFEHYCRNCRRAGSAEDLNVWQFCPVCGGALIVWNVQTCGNGVEEVSR